MIYHWRDGWVFERGENSSVHIATGSIEAVIPVDEWASIVAAVSRGGETVASWRLARFVHQYPLPPSALEENNTDCEHLWEMRHQFASPTLMDLICVKCKQVRQYRARELGAESGGEAT